MPPLCLLRLSVTAILADEVAAEENHKAKHCCYRESKLKRHDRVEMDGRWDAPDGDADERLTDDCCLEVSTATCSSMSKGNPLISMALEVLGRGGEADSAFELDTILRADGSQRSGVRVKFKLDHVFLRA